MSASFKPMKLLFAIMLFVGFSHTGLSVTVYDAGEALIEALEKGATTGMFTDCHGGTWTFGDLSPDALTDVLALQGVHRESSGFNGFTPNGAVKVPFAIVNTTNEPLAHGQETGDELLNPGEILLHPNAPSSSRPYVAIKFVPPHDGVFRVDATVRDLLKTYDGVNVSLYAHDAVQWSGALNLGKTSASLTFSVGLYLRADEAATLIVDPVGSYQCDSTGVFLTFTEESSGLGPLVCDVNGVFLAAANRESLEGGPISCGGRSSNGEETLFTAPYEQANITCKGFVFSGSTFPWVMVNTLNGISACDKSSIGNGYCLQPHELLAHPNSGDGNSTFVRFAVPSTGVYRAVGVFRDVAKDGSFGCGVVARIESAGRSAFKDACVSAEDNTGLGILDLRWLELKAGETVDFSIANNGAHYYDSTGMQLFLFADELSGSQVINVDIDGKQPSDAEPVTFSGTAKFSWTGTKWNSIFGVENERVVIEKHNLFSANGEETGISVKLEATDGKLTFDNLRYDLSNQLLGDYLYVGRGAAPVTMTVTGLVPGAFYDLYLYTAVNGKTLGARVTFGGKTWVWEAAGAKVFSEISDHLVLCGLQADGEGKIVGQLQEASGKDSVYNGFQLVGTFPGPKRGLLMVVH